MLPFPIFRLGGSFFLVHLLLEDKNKAPSCVQAIILRGIQYGLKKSYVFITYLSELLSCFLVSRFAYFILCLIWSVFASQLYSLSHLAHKAGVHRRRHFEAFCLDSGSKGSKPEESREVNFSLD